MAEIKLRHLNREYILKRTGEIEQLEKDIADLNDILAKPARIRKIIIKELTDVAKKYAQPRRSEILYDLPEEESGIEEEVIPDYPVTVFFTREGYLKKIPPQSLRTAGAHKLKEGDEIIQQVETRNNVEALFFTDRQQVYKVRLNELEDGKVAQMGIFIPGRLGMDEGENVLAMVITSDYSGFMLFFFESGKCAKIPLNSYATKLNRRKLLKAYCDKEPLAKLLFLPHSADQRQGHPRQPGRGGRYPEEEPAHRVGRPGGDAGTGQPTSLPRPQPARHRCPHPRRGRRRAADASVKERTLCRTST